MSLPERLEPASVVPEPGDDSTQSDSPPIGLFQLWPYPELMSSSGFEFDVDIVAIHGLGGHAFGTWTEGQKLWLQDFIPKDISRARVLTFGYNSEDAFTKPTASIREFAIQLLDSLRQLRQQATNKSVGYTVNENLKKLQFMIT
ncbi:uncharacterized protein BHQ10_007629 [Talaromyces amestolkiae]|uniref:Phospholipase/carboxylesterase/thioesterase domain-containing protein n=1 Tax=Talaromyces amestolkiae TaxID=1196081 RepID=A0A364L736_TALAM|nr:uncharacterized protein BHQ10_007629 [Talaromyces amestolkiae]RAO71617.1 hypothetical protein BHQ10_007629 [Talaromyces amestolkiae]